MANLEQCCKHIKVRAELHRAAVIFPSLTTSSLYISSNNIKMLSNKSEMGVLALALFSSSASALNPSCAPGGNFNLSPFVLQLPSGTTNHPDQIPASQLEGCGGYQDPGHKYFFTESGDGAMVMKAPGGGHCATFPGAPRCRTEFGETNSWSSTASTNRLKADLLVTGGSQICIGQVFQSNSNNKPLVSQLS